MRGLVHAVLVFLASLVAVWLATAALGMIAADLFAISQAEGAYAMGLFFIIGPLAGLAGAIAITAFAVSRRRRRLAGKLPGG